MRFPHQAYADMVAAEESSLNTRQVAKDSAVEKKVLSESAIEDEDDTPGEEGEPEDENLVD